MANRVLALLLCWSPIAAAATTRNDASCDVGPLPAATLLLPYFEVDFRADYDRYGRAKGKTTVVTITNVTNADRIVHATLWTDASYPVLGFNIYLTGYGAQTIDLYDVFARGVIIPDAGTGTAVNRRGRYSRLNASLDLSGCRYLAGVLDEAIVTRLQWAFTEGINAECGIIGGEYDNAVGYMTFDVVGSCNTASVTEPSYWTDDLRYDNVLIGDYRQFDSKAHRGDGGPMVHIRAVPEGAGSRIRSEFPHTFYERFHPGEGALRDRRQPLPSRFAAHWIAGENRETSLAIWRQSPHPATNCATNPSEPVEIVRFDEDENATAEAITSLPSTSTTIVPQLPNGATSGWVYVNAFDDQSWLISSMHADVLSVDSEGVALGNGCSAPVRTSGEAIAPPPNDAHVATLKTTANNDDSCDIAALPAATLLLPYFEVDPDDPERQSTLFSVTNVSPQDRVAHVALWTDLSVPILEFNIALTGYDMQSINLRDIFERGILPGACGSPGPLSEEMIQRLWDAFLEGMAGECHEVGFEHDNAIGFLTIDVVASCTTHSVIEPAYWREDIRYDNVLIGDYQDINPWTRTASGGPMVHIRAVPEGGTPQQRLLDPDAYDAGFPYTFYRRYQSARTPKLDGRQPLPSLFAAPWSQGGVYNASTSFKIWREGKPATTDCAKYDDRAFTPLVETVTFDQAENAVSSPQPCHCNEPILVGLWMQSTSKTPVDDPWLFEPLHNGAVSGWMYFNLGDGDARQGWVIASRIAGGPWSADIDAVALGNGCSPAEKRSEVDRYGYAVIGPRP